MNRSKKCHAAILAILVMAGVGHAFGEELQAFVAGATDLTSPSNYTGSRLPSAGEYVILSNGTVHVTYGTPSWTTLASLGRVVCMDATGTARLEITVPESEVAELGLPVSGSEYNEWWNAPWRFGGISKKGKGELRLTSWNTISANEDYFCSIDVNEGVLAMAPADVTTGTFSQMGHLTVAAGATFVPAPGNGDRYGILAPHGISGAGTVENRGTDPISIRISNNTSFFPGDFSGNFVGSYNYIRNADSGSQTLRGLFPGAFSAEAVYTGAASFGNGTDLSSIGVRDVSLSAATLEYVGQGENSSRNFTLQGSGPSVISAGPNGGLTLSGNFKHIVSEYVENGMRGLTLSGDNASPATFAAATPADNVAEGVAYTVYTAKEGTGTWHFAEHASRFSAGGFAVRDGVLEFDSIEEAGLVSSLGTATNLTDGYTGSYDASRAVDYFLALGSADVAKKPVLKFTGSASQACATRPIRMFGDGTFRNDGAARIRWAGVSAAAGAHTLVLDGSSAAENEMSDATDGDGVLSIRKEGSGTWVLGGDQTFGGTLDVRAGKLIVRKPSSNVYSWFRWTVRECDDGSYYDRVTVDEIVFCDKDGVRQEPGVVQGVNAVDLEPGQAAFASRYGIYADDGSSGKGVGRFFDMQPRGNSASVYAMYPTTSDKCRIRLSDPKTWPSLVIRLPEGSGEIATWDYMNVWKKTSGNGQTVTNSKLEGSVDGLHWECVDESGYSDIYDDGRSYTWAFAGDWWDNDSSTSTHVRGRGLSAGSSAKVYSQLENVETVRVSSGAILEADGDVTLSRLTVDAQDAGTLRGFKLASTGSLTVENAPRSGFALPMDLTGAEGVENLSNWQLAISDASGRALKNRTVAVGADGTVTIDAPGCVVHVR